MKTDDTNYHDFDTEAFFKDAVMNMPEDPPRPTIRPMIERNSSPRLQPPICNISDALQADFLEPALVELKANFGLWRASDARTKQSLWELLGDIYELSPMILQNENARADLVEGAKQIEEVRESAKWHPDRKHPYELLLVVLFGSLSEKKSKRSQWLSALKAAEAANVETSSRAFVDWISEIGGIEAARKLYAKPRAPKPPTQIEDILARIHVNNHEQIELPMSMWGFEREDGLSLMLVKHSSGDKVAPVFSFADERQIVAVWDAYEKHGRRNEREMTAQIDGNRRKFDRERKAKARAEFKKAKKRGRTNLAFDEWWSEYEMEHPLTNEEERIRCEGR